MGRIREDVAERTCRFVADVLRFVDELSKHAGRRAVAWQLLRCSSSILANVDEADNALSEADFRNKITSARRVAAEVITCLELATRGALASEDLALPLRKEADELVHIFDTTALRMHGPDTKPLGGTDPKE